jgi:hypothetical protein
MRQWQRRVSPHWVSKTSDRQARSDNKKARFHRENVLFALLVVLIQALAGDQKKAASLAIDDWLVFARRGLNSRVQAVMAGYCQTPLEEVVPTIPGTEIRFAYYFVRISLPRRVARN